MSSEARQLGAGVGGEEIEKAVRAVFAATIWHTSSLSAHVQQYGKFETIFTEFSSTF